MKESILKDYFAGDVDACSLKVFLSEIAGVNQLRADTNLNLDLADDYPLTLQHMIRICDDYESGDLEVSNVTAIAFFLLGSDHFGWDSATPTGAVIAELISDWSTPEIDFPITRDNMAAIRRSLTEGRYDRHLLKG